MLDELGRQLPGIPRHQAQAERLPLADGSVDAVTAAQAWHWFDQPAAAAEFLRVVRPGGVIGLLWNVRDDRVGWMAAMSELVDGEDSMRAKRSDALPGIREVAPGRAPGLRALDRDDARGGRRPRVDVLLCAAAP